MTENVDLLGALRASVDRARTSMVTIAGRPVPLGDIAEMLSRELEGQMNLVAGGMEWHIDNDAEVKGNRIQLTAEVDVQTDARMPARYASAVIVLRVESVSVR